jgi:carboxyl-terminal processing protease
MLGSWVRWGFFSLWLLSTSLLFGGALPQERLRLETIPSVMTKLFSYHISVKEFTPEMVKRAFKISLEHFDAEKQYLLASEAALYEEASDEVLQQAAQRLTTGNYQDFVHMYTLFQQAVIRAQKMRQGMIQEVVGVSPPLLIESYQSYAVSSKDLRIRQCQNMQRFFDFHSKHTDLSTVERRTAVYALYEDKARRQEYRYLFVDANGRPFSQEFVEHLFALRVLKALAKSLDTHTAFYSSEEAYQMRTGLEKQFEGVGIVLSEGIDGVMIADLIEGSSAQESGMVQVNDLLVEIDGQSLQGYSFEEVLEVLKKKDQGEILLGLKRAGSSKIQRVLLSKRPIVMQEERIRVGYQPCEGGIIGKIALYSFYEMAGGHSSEKDLKEAIQGLKQKGNLVGLVLDLRENSGGFLSQAVKVSGLFISNGVVVIAKYGNGEKHYLRSLTGHPFCSLPLVILTSKMSASASEIVAQTLQDYGVALIVGDERTFGKGSIQYQTITDQSAKLFFKVTVGRYYSVAGKSTQIEGVVADIVIPTQFAPYQIGEKYLEYPLSQDRVEPAFQDTLSDLDPRHRHLFQEHYLPALQREVVFWKERVSELRDRSQQRLLENRAFQTLFREHEVIRQRQNPWSVNRVDAPIQTSLSDLQMQEAVHVVEDMLSMQRDSALSLTGTDPT